MQGTRKCQTLHTTLFTTNHSTSYNQGHFNLKAFSIEIHNNIQAHHSVFIAQQPESHNCSCVSGCPGVVGPGPARMQSPEPCHPPGKPAQSAHLSLFIRSVRPQREAHISKTAIPFCWGLLGPFPPWWLQAGAPFAPQLEPLGSEVTVTSRTSCMVPSVPTAQGAAPGAWSWASVLGQAITISAQLEHGWSLGNLAGAQAFVTEVYPCCCLSWREWLSF